MRRLERRPRGGSSGGAGGGEARRFAAHLAGPGEQEKPFYTCIECALEAGLTVIPPLSARAPWRWLADLPRSLVSYLAAHPRRCLVLRPAQAGETWGVGAHSLTVRS